jgi:hypothetical protein
MSSQPEAQMVSLSNEVSANLAIFGNYVVEAVLSQAFESEKFGPEEWFNIPVKMVLTKNPAAPGGDAYSDSDQILLRICVCYNGICRSIG